MTGFVLVMTKIVFSTRICFLISPFLMHGTWTPRKIFSKSPFALFEAFGSFFDLPTKFQCHRWHYAFQDSTENYLGSVNNRCSPSNSRFESTVTERKKQ